jgi:hypothetical protein
MVAMLTPLRRDKWPMGKFAIRHELTAHDLKQTMFAYPTGASDVGYML